MTEDPSGYWSRLRPIVRDVQSQVCSVVRHAERADGFALFNGLPWTRSEDFHRWPFDPPLSDAGELGALQTAEAIHGSVTKLDAAIDVVVTSPYLRCVQTAAVICAKLGPDTRLMIDVSVGEIFGPAIFGDCKPEKHRRSLQSLLEECKRRGVENVFANFFGTEPAWPESLQAGRQRFVESFLKYQERSFNGCRSFIIVTHGDCVAAAATLFPLAARMKTVEPGGMLLASRRARKSSELWLSSTTLRNKWQKGRADRERALDDTCSGDEPSPPQGVSAMCLGGWSVNTFLLNFDESKSPRKDPFKKVLKSMARLTFSPVNLPSDRVQELLDTFSGKPSPELDAEKCFKRSNMRGRSMTGKTFVLALDALDALDSKSRDYCSETPECSSDALTRAGSHDAADHSANSSSAHEDDEPQLPDDPEETPSSHDARPTLFLQPRRAFDNLDSSSGASRPSPKLQPRCSTDPLPVGAGMNFASSLLWQRRTHTNL
eukprot:TRINITY_DN36378_c0_g1_i1.p1 TRINITY_DN36378_c0_g1~~TRINITY_DN36378_c0_g1_i1.p1  ORF type:complete len:489 (-),score=53.08 TRINITY_DN36378_c0_g1_i1:553-2019(-)